MSHLLNNIMALMATCKPLRRNVRAPEILHVIQILAGNTEYWRLGLSSQTDFYRFIDVPLEAHTTPTGKFFFTLIFAVFLQFFKNENEIT